MKKYISFLICAAILVALLPAQAFAAELGGDYISSEGACVLDYETSEVLYEYNGNIPRVSASMTKIMAVYCVYDALKNGEISLDTNVPISQNVYSKSRNSVYQSVLPLYYDTAYTVDEMIDVAIVYSASGAVVALAELVGGGSEAAFVDRMNKKAAEMELDAWYYDSCGIAENQISPISMANLARNIIMDYPDILTRSAKTSVSFHGNTYKTTNHLLDTYYYEGADGFKNGMTDASGYCMSGTAKRDGKRIITVTLPSNSNEARFTDSILMFNYGFEKLGVDTTGAENRQNDTISVSAKDITINIDGNYVLPFPDQKPVIKNDRILVPIRALMETLEKNVEWDSDSKTTTISDDTTTVRLTVGSDIMEKTIINPIDGTVKTEAVILEAPPEILKDRTCLPVRAVVEAFGATVIWDPDTGTMLIIAGVC